MDRTDAVTAAAAPTRLIDGSYMDWPAILGGAAIATAVAALFTTFGAALGLSALSVEPGEGSLNLAILLAGVWMVVTLVASYAVGGYVAGRMHRRLDQATPDEVNVRDGINGLVVWAVSMLLGATILTNAATGIVATAGAAAGTVVEAAGAAAGGLAEGALGAAGAAVGASDADPVGYMTDTLLRPQTASPTADTADGLAAQAAGILGNVLATGEISDAERTYLESAVAARTGLPAAQVSERVDTAIAAARTARDDAAALAAEAEQTAIDIAESARISAVLTAFVLAAAALVAAATSFVAAVRGGQHRDAGRVYGGLSYTRSPSA